MDFGGISNKRPAARRPAARRCAAEPHGKFRGKVMGLTHGWWHGWMAIYGNGHHVNNQQWKFNHNQSSIIINNHK